MICFHRLTVVQSLSFSLLPVNPQQVDIAARKAGIVAGAPLKLSRFRVDRYREKTQDRHSRQSVRDFIISQLSFFTARGKAFGWQMRHVKSYMENL
jgi:hypothetical protein